MRGGPAGPGAAGRLLGAGLVLGAALLVAGLPDVAQAAPAGPPLAWSVDGARNLFAALFLVSALVFIHETGHFFFAKLFGVGVPVYSFGFGRRLFGVEFRGTDYRVSALPFGGYVRMEGADPYGNQDEGADPVEQAPSSFAVKPVWQRFLIMFGGPLFNLVFPVALFTTLYVAGEPTEISEVGDVLPDSAAEEAGIRAGDQLVAVDGVETPTWIDVDAAFSDDPKRARTLRVQRSGALLELRYQPPAEGYGAEGTGLTWFRPSNLVGVDEPASPAGQAGVRTGERVVAVDGAPIADWIALERALAAAPSPTLTVEDPEGAQREVRLSAGDWLPRSLGHRSSPAHRFGLVTGSVFIDEVKDTLDDGGPALPGLAAEPAPSPAKAAGLQAGDRVFAVDGQPIDRWNDLVRGIRASGEGAGPDGAARPVELQVVRGGELLVLELRPVMAETVDAGLFNRRFMIGAAPEGESVGPKLTPKAYPVGQAVARATRETVLISGLIVERLGDLVTRKAAVSENIGGPIAMMRQGAEAAERGIFTYARQIGLLSISLGILNLLPVPVFDGGQLLFLAMEAVRGRPVSGVLRERALQIGVIFVVIAMALAVVNDSSRELKRWLAEP